MANIATRKFPRTEPYNKECSECLFVSTDGGCDLSWVLKRTRKGLFTQLGYTGSGGADCPLRAETEKRYKEIVRKYGE